MPAFVMREGERFRIFHGSGAGSARLMMRNGEPVDGGGFRERTDAARLARQINDGKREDEEEAREA